MSADWSRADIMCVHGCTHGYAAPAGDGYDHSFSPVTGRRCGYGFEICLVAAGLYILYPWVMCLLSSIIMKYISNTVEYISSAYII